ncbi:hypothetical protein KFB04_24300 [Klebsiella pneumoniae]|uniref:hypothetical protein n=1 Tax=Klebsiella pneumoniae TaxID=573 RepID=UPI001CC13FF0|nr:hypothetical protein [Klebsiella pneumoniae]MBZ1641298.1 hypothetical protein [Klebsiella pneumoniae]
MPDRSSNPPNAYQQLNNPGAAITQLARDIAENNANTTQKSISSIGTLASGPVLELSDSAQDVLYALFFRGALVSGDIPSKAGASALRSLGFAETGHTATPYKGEDYFTWLTPAGYAFAIGYLVKTRFGKPPANAIASGQPSVHPEGLSINKAMIKGEISSAAHVCGNAIEQETLSSVLAHYLPNTPLDKARDHAVMLASAVKASFAELNHSTGGFVISRDGAAQVIGEKSSETTIPASALKPSTDGKEKQGATFTINIEVDASKAIQALDEFSHAFDKRIASTLEKGLMPGGKLREAISQKADVSGNQSLSHRVSGVESALANLSSQIMVLQTKHASPV